MQRYGIRWDGPTNPISVEMPDGYWTPWHIANAEIEALRKALHEILMVCEPSPVATYQRMESIARATLSA